MAIFEPHIFDAMSGNQRHVEAILRLFDRQVAEPVLLTPRQTNYGDMLIRNGLKVAVLPAPGLLKKFGADISGMGRLGKLRMAFNLVSYWPRVYFWLRRNRIDAVECNSTRGMVMVGPAAKLLGLPLIFYVKGVLDTPLPDRLALRMADTILFQGEKIRDQSYPGILRGSPKIEILSNGIDLGEVDAALADNDGQEKLRAQIGARRDAINIATAGQISDRRGQDRLISAVAALQKRGIACRLFILGDYITAEFFTYFEHCKALVTELGVTGVSFMGHRPDAVAVMGVMDIIALPSRNEGVPKAILEGMALGKPAVVTDVGSVRDAVGAAEGFVIPVDDAPALEQALARLAMDGELRGMMGAAGRHKARAQFDINRNIRGLERIFLRALERKA